MAVRIRWAGLPFSCAGVRRMRNSELDRMMPSGLRISWAMLAVMIAGLHEGLPEVKFVSDQLQLLFIFGAMMVGGILISLVFTAFAVRKFLRMRTDKLYLY